MPRNPGPRPFSTLKDNKDKMWSPDVVVDPGYSRGPLDKHGYMNFERIQNARKPKNIQDVIEMRQEAAGSSG